MLRRRLRFVRREAVAALKTEYPSEPAAVDGIRRRLTDFYKDADRALAPDVARSVSAVERLYRVNVFPEMKVTWGTYLSNLGHTDRAGCFRCHDEGHTSKEGRTIRQDCELCHKMQ